MNRITRDQLYIEIANLFAKRSTCFRANIGAVIVYNNHIVSHGFNGAPAGEPHCSGQDCPLTASGGCSRAIHAEINALSNLPLDPCDQVFDLTLYVSQSPCPSCAQAIVTDGRFNKVFYNTEYRLRGGIDYLLAHGIEVYRITTSGYIINAKDSTLLI